jgi:nicotinamide-nucleotide amidase
MSRIEILTIGDELIEGRLVDTNAGELSALLVDAGYTAAQHLTIGDDVAVIADELRAAAARADAVLVSGGLGPTEDDLTAAAAAVAFSREITRFPEALEHARRFFADRGREMPPTNEKQADLPDGSAVIPNPVGTAVGFRLDAEDCRLYFMPGVPRELRRMAEETVLPDLASRLSPEPPSVATVKVFGLGESDVAHRLAGIEELAPPTASLVVQYRATFPEIHVRFVAVGGDPASVEASLNRMTEDAGRRLGHHVFATGGARLDTDFPTAVAMQLVRSDLGLAAAEVASSGAVSVLLDASDPGRRCFRGGLNVKRSSDLIARLGLDVDEAEAIADAVRSFFGASIGVATLGTADGSDGRPAGTIIVAASGPGGTSVREICLPLDRDRFRRLAAYAGLKLALSVTPAG